MNLLLTTTLLVVLGSGCVILETVIETSTDNLELTNLG